MVYMYHSFLIHSSADGHLGCFHVLVIINSAAMNIGVHVSLSDLVSLVCMPRSGIALFPEYFKVNPRYHIISSINTSLYHQQIRPLKIYNQKSIVPYNKTKRNS